MEINASKSVEERTLWVEHDGERIFGKLFVPRDNTAPRPAAICSHHLGGTYHDSGEYARELAKAGFVSYAFDFCGGSPDSLSTSETTRSSIQTQKADLEAVFDTIAALPETDEDNIFLMGQSQGGMVSIMLADERPQDIKGLILLYPALGIRDVTIRLFGTPENVPEAYAMWQPLGRIYALDAFDYDVFEHMEDYAGEVLIFHGDLDSIVPLSYAQRAAETFPHATLHVVPDAKHGFFGKQRMDILEEIERFIQTVSTSD